MAIRKRLIIFLSLLLFSFATKEFYHLNFPSHFPKPIYDFEKNNLTIEKVTLGRVLFYDPLLSSDGTISCASCHSPYNSFAHPDHNLSHGIRGFIGTRNAPALMNLAWQNSFMWDGAINHLDVQALAPISHPKEMGEDIKHVAEKLRDSRIYPTLFFNAYGDSTITGERILKSLSQFQLTLVSANSKYDRVIQNKEVFTEQESLGYELFKQHCNSCHKEPLFTTYQFANNGLPVDTTLNDFGRWMVTKRNSDSLLFKIPTLRNLSYSYPFMHDGRFNKLIDVINHYTNGVEINSTLSKELRNPIILSDDEKADLIAFLICLNDKEFIFNPNNQFPKEILLY